MKQSKMRILCLLLTAVMLLSLTACGKDKKEENSNVMKLSLIHISEPTRP